MAKYITIIDTDAYKDFKFFEDGCGEYLIAKDDNAQADEWIRLPFIKVETILNNIPKRITNGDMIQTLFPDIEIYDSKVMESIYTGIPFGEYIGANVDCMRDWWNAPYKAEKEDKE